jgi:Coenzyme PQQ synthesis protein D (PqqD)
MVTKLESSSCQVEGDFVNMFQWLGKFEKILVTGPQRSGTRICSKIIAHDTGHKYIDEFVIGVDGLYQLWAIFENNSRFVVQCPALCRHIHMFNRDDAAIVLMRRDVKDIIASQERIGWNCEKVELARYNCRNGVISEIKYNFWKENQKKHIKHAFEVEYESLSGHQLWVPKPLRRNFSTTQTKCQNENLSIDPDTFPCQVRDVLCCEDAAHSTARLVKTKGPVKSLNASGDLVWNLCDGTRTRNDILVALKNHFSDVDSNTLGNDLDDFIREMVVKRFLRLSSGKSAL